MTEPAITMNEVQGLLDGMVGRAGPVVGAVLISGDGLMAAASSGLDREGAEHLAALASGMQGLARGASRRFAGGGLLQGVIEMDSILVFMVPAGEHACLAAFGSPEVDAGAVVYEMTELAERLADHPLVAPRSGFGVR